MSSSVAVDPVTTAKHTLLRWADERVLKDVIIADDGSSLSYQDTIVANVNITIEQPQQQPEQEEGGGKKLLSATSTSITYSLISLYLQIRDPDQGLLAYRNACKRYHCSDPVKALDKPLVVQFFIRDRDRDNYPEASVADDTTTTITTTTTNHAIPLPPGEATTSAIQVEDGKTGEGAAGGISNLAAAAAANSRATGSEEAAEQQQQQQLPMNKREQEEVVVEKLDHQESDRSSKDRRRDKERSKDGKHRSSASKDSSSSKHHHHRDRIRDHDDARKKKSAKSSSSNSNNSGMVSNEQLLTNLSAVVGKRQLEERKTIHQEEIRKALSAEGFQHVSAEQLEKYKEVTARILANEFPVGNSASILRATNPKQNLQRVLDLYMDSIQSSLKGKESSNKHVGSSGKPGSSRPSLAGGGNTTAKPDRSYLIGKKPVIVVPKGMTSPLTLVNAYEFFCNGRYVPRDVMLKSGGGGGGGVGGGVGNTGGRGNPLSTTFTRKMRGAGVSNTSIGHTGLLEFEIMDNPKKLGNNPKEWERIVAVVVLGQSWQFKDWPPPYNSPVQLFSLTLGYFISMEGDQLPAEIHGWAVKQGKLNRDKRGLDSVTLASFWNAVEEFMSVHRSELLPQPEV